MPKNSTGFANGKRSGCAEYSGVDRMVNSRNLLDKLEAKLTIRGKKAGYAGLGFMILMTLTLNTLVFLRGFGNMDAVWARNIGVNLMAGPLCAVIYYCCLQDSAGVGDENALFLALLITSAIGIFLSGCRWLAEGVPSLVFWNRLVNVLLLFNDYMMLFMFWRCTLFLLEIKDRIRHFITSPYCSSFFRTCWPRSCSV